MNSKYIPKEFEGKWIERWEEEKVYQVETVPAGNKMYTLVMFPYPSGAGLHTGHARVYTGTDVLARFFRMKGYSVLHPMGWDAFGLPAENAAVKEKKNPIDMVPHNIANFKRQMRMLGLSYDWSREFSTTDPIYYKWTQWLFIQFFKMGLLYKKETPIFYCESCKTGLAQEEVLPDGRHERCGNQVAERNLPQWIFRITTYADRLLQDLDGLEWPEGILEMQKNWIGKKVTKKGTTYHLRDWIFSRQRYWGEPIPMIFCQKCADSKKSWFTTNEAKDHLKKYQNITKVDQNIQDSSCGWYPLCDEELPLKLPYIKEYKPTETGESPLSQISEFVKTTCPNCSSEAKRETDTMPNWAGSCWYFLYFAKELSLDRHSGTSPKDEVIESQKNEILSSPEVSSRMTNVLNWNRQIGNSSKDWLPVDWYIGGAEHAVLHLLYARFWVKAMNDLGLINFTEPFTRLQNVGMVLAEDHRKMSKSLGNVINPDNVVQEFGADALRVYEMFMAPFNQEVVWSTSSLQGSYRFLKRIWQVYTNPANITDDGNEEDKSIAAELQTVISKVSADITNVKFNTSISTMMEFLNLWEDKSEAGNQKSEIRRLHSGNAKSFLKLLAPFAPFMTEELWRGRFGENESIHIAPWPESQQGLIEEKEVVIPIQVNGKVRGTVTVSQSNIAQNLILEKALQDERIKIYIEDKKYTVIYVKGKIMNIVIL